MGVTQSTAGTKSNRPRNEKRHSQQGISQQISTAENKETQMLRKSKQCSDRFLF